MTVHLTKVAFGCSTLDELSERIAMRAAAGQFVTLTTRYLPKRHEEIAGQGSLYWIVRHQLAARSPIIDFAEAEGGRTAIRLEPRLILVEPRPRRAHQGWRYLEPAEAPADLGGGAVQAMDELPPAMLGDLSAIGLL